MSEVPAKICELLKAGNLYPSFAYENGSDSVIWVDGYELAARSVLVVIPTTPPDPTGLIVSAPADAPDAMPLAIEKTFDPTAE